jgi:ectoine hydroxylase-related dioxygenase (phytanoyl-CoA dioxygenase family)
MNAELPSATGLTEADHARYRTDGAVLLRGLFEDWVEPLRAAVEGNLRAPGPLGTRYGKDGHKGRFHGDRYMWTFDPEFRRYAFEGPGAAVAAQLMQASKVNLFYDHLLVKEPGAEAPTPWHQDLPYWCVEGGHICSIWVALDPVERDTGMLAFLRGSHLWNRQFSAPDFQFRSTFSDELEPMPDIDAHPEDYDVLTWDAMQPGDAIAFHALAVHGARGNAHADRRRRAISTRWLGDHVTYREHPNVTKPIRDPGLKHGEPMDCALFPRVWPAPTLA